MFPPEVLRRVKIYRLPSSGNKVYPGSPTSTVSAAVLPLDRKNQALLGNVFRDPWEVYFDPDVDVKVSDKLVIQDETGAEGTYFVQQRFVARFGGLPHVRCTVSRED